MLLLPDTLLPIDPAISETLSGTLTRQADQRCELSAELLYRDSILRVIAGPQFKHFSDQGIQTIFSGEYTLSSQADRMGARLSGAIIEHANAESRDIVSDAIVPGSIQVPGSGQPIVLLNDAHTAGGYPKIATVISCDLPLLGLRRIGSRFKFVLVTIEEAIAARRNIDTLTHATINAFKPCTLSEPSVKALLSSNLIDGVTDGFTDE